MKPFKNSIKTHLLLWLSVPMLLLWLLQSILTYSLAMNLATDAFDKGLLDSVFSIFSCINFANGKISADIPPVAIAMLKENIKDKVYYRVSDENGKFIAGDAILPPPKITRRKYLGVKSAHFKMGNVMGNQARIAQVAFANPQKIDCYIFIQVAETLASRNQVADEIIISIVLPQFIMLVLFLLIVRFGVDRGLVPLELVRNAVAKRTAFDLSPIAEPGAPIEVKPLVKAINNLLQQLNNDIQSQKRFVANAAHQLRTPVAGLKTQAELALRINKQDDLKHNLELIKTSATRASRLINQLLSLAKAEPRVMTEDELHTIDFNLIIKDVCTEFVQLALSRNIDFGFENASETAFIKANKVAIHELVANLIENALIYTQNSGKVTVKVDVNKNLTKSDQAQAVLVVEDNGPGIALDERDKVFERFYRILGTKSSGSGLGLAIVKEIVKTYNGKIFLESGDNNTGLKVIVKFPLISR